MRIVESHGGRDGLATERDRSRSHRPVSTGSSRRFTGLRALVCAAILLQSLLGDSLEAHDFTITQTLLILKNDGTFQAEMTVDLDSMLAGASGSHDPAELRDRIQALDAADLEQRLERLRSTFERRVRVRFDGEPAPFSVTFPDRFELEPDPESPSFLGVTARLRGRVPKDAQAVTFWASRAFSAVQLTLVKGDRDNVYRQVLSVGEESLPYSLTASETGSVEPGLGVATVLRQYLRLGFLHILPLGLDHILFVLGLFLLSTRWRPLLLQVSAFTVAHTLTLALGLYGLVSLPAAVTEPLIAASIVFVAVENLVTQELKPWRVWLVFAFGLLHGLGFAGVLTELGLPANYRLTALVGFNLGVELGQLAVIVMAFVAVGWWWRRQWYRRRVVVPLSLSIALVGGYWVVTRIAGGL